MTLYMRKTVVLAQLQGLGHRSSSQWQSDHRLRASQNQSVGWFGVLWQLYRLCFQMAAWTFAQDLCLNK